MDRRSFLKGAALCLAGCAAGTSGTNAAQWRAWGGQGWRDGSFIRPRAIGVFVDEIYVIDTTGRVQVFSPSGDFIRLWNTPSYENGTPTGITFTSDGTVIVPDTHNSQILEYTLEGKLLQQWGSYGAGEDQFIYPTDVAMDAAGNFFISEYGQHAERVHVFTPDRKFLRQWGEHGTEAGQFNRAMGLSIASDGAVLVADTANHRVQCFGLDGVLVSVLGQNEKPEESLKFPQDLALAPDDTLLVAEYGNHRISRFARTGQFLAAYGAPGRAPGELNAPRGVAYSADGTVFVADTDNHRVQCFRPEPLA